MKYKLVIVLVFQILFGFSQKTDLSKSVLFIPDSLKQNANVVIRHYHTDVDIQSIKSMRTHYKKIITVLNKQGNDAFFVESYDKYTSIHNIKITIYNAFGKVIKKVKSKEIKDIALADGFSLFRDDRNKYYKYITNKYPYTIEVSYNRNTSNTAFIPRWFAYGDTYQSVQKKTFTITHPLTLQLSYEENNFSQFNIVKTEVNNSITYSVSNLKALKSENFSPAFSKITPNVVFGLNIFSLSGEIGNASSWGNFGKWMHEKLLKGRDEIPEATKNDIKNLTKGIEDPIERAKLVYEYMQDRTRYISVQIGIGGWKPMLSEDVDRLRYGDCKALSFYTKNLLNIANVDAAYTLVYSGRKKNINKNLVSPQGNHAILMVPSKKDTIWLECTSQKLPFGQTSGTNDRDVLIISDNVGKIVHTNKYEAKHNYQKITGTLHLDKKGNIQAKITRKSFGTQYNNRFRILYKDKKEQRDTYKDEFSNLIDVKIDSLYFENIKKDIIFIEHIHLSTKYAQIIGNDMIIPINAFNVYTNLPKRIRNRKYPVNISSGFLDEDEVIIHIPENYKITELPKEVLLETKFGKYQMSITKINDKKLLYKRVLLLKENEYPKETYDSFRNFIKTIIKYDKQKIILSKI